MFDDWMLMVHGFVNGVFDHQEGPRGDEKWFTESMLMAVGRRTLGPGVLGLRGMFSLDPTMGKNGYPLLLQSGETADGRTPLIDRQHPHDLFMEMAASYRVPLAGDASAFGYFGLPGEPALGPPVFMHRFSGMDNPEAPISHHWLDSSHVTFGVATLGLVWRDWKLDGSIFTGREPNQYRWDIDEPRFDSQSVRLAFNPTPEWALQTSYGHIVSPESLEADVDQDRITASAMHHRRFGENDWQTTFAWGQNRNRPGSTLDAFLLESAVRLRRRHTIFGRLERVDKDELAEGTFTVHKLSVGYVHDFPSFHRAQPGLGGVVALDLLPAVLRPTYGGGTPSSITLFARLKLN